MDEGGGRRRWTKEVDEGGGRRRWTKEVDEGGGRRRKESAGGHGCVHGRSSAHEWVRACVRECVRARLRFCACLLRSAVRPSPRRDMGEKERS
jgi:hypothetical protein